MAVFSATQKTQFIQRILADTDLVACKPNHITNTTDALAKAYEEVSTDVLPAALKELMEEKAEVRKFVDLHFKKSTAVYLGSSIREWFRCGPQPDAKQSYPTVYKVFANTYGACGFKVRGYVTRQTGNYSPALQELGLSREGLSKINSILHEFIVAKEKALLLEEQLKASISGIKTIEQAWEVLPENLRKYLVSPKTPKTKTLPQVSFKQVLTTLTEIGWNPKN